MMGMGEKPRNTKTKTKEKFPVWLNSVKWRPTVFRCPITPKRSRIYPKWQRVPNLMGPKKTGWVRCGQLIADMIFVLMKSQDFQLKWVELRYKNNSDGEDLGD